MKKYLSKKTKKNNNMNTTNYGCVIQISLIILYGFIGSWLIGLSLDIWVSEHTWFELGWGLRWLIGVFLGKFALIALLVGMIAGVILGFPIITIGG